MRLPRLAVLVACLSLTAYGSGQAVRVGGAGNRIARPRIILGAITVTASPSSVSIPLRSGGTAVASAPIVINTTYGGVSVISSFVLYAYFASATSALSGGTPVVSIPSSCVLGQMTTGTPTTYTAFTSTTPFSGASGLQLFSGAALLSLGGSRTDSLNLEVNLSSLPQLPAATYTGTVTFIAQAF